MAKFAAVDGMQLSEMVCKICGKPIIDGQLTVATFGPMSENGVAPVKEVWHAECETTEHE